MALDQVPLDWLPEAIAWSRDFHAGGAGSMILEAALLTAMVRPLAPEIQDRVAAEIPHLVEHLAKAAGIGLHHPTYDFNNEALPAAASVFAAIVEQEMPT